VDPYVPRAGSVLTIPLQTLLPDAPREGLVINLAELRLYYYPPGKNEVTGARMLAVGVQVGLARLSDTVVTIVGVMVVPPSWPMPHHHADNGYHRVRQAGQSDLDANRQHSRALQSDGDGIGAVQEIDSAIGGEADGVMSHRVVRTGRHHRRQRMK
jgi:hypothetical protein